MNHQMVALHHGDFHKLLVDVEVELEVGVGEGGKYFLNIFEIKLTY